MSEKIRTGEELNESAIKTFLQQQELIKDAKSEISISQFSNGFSNLTYLLKIEDMEYVLRRPPFGAIKRGHDMGREFNVLSKLYKAFPKSPKALAYTEDLDVLGAPFYIMEKIDGIIISNKETKSRTISPGEFKTIANSWMDTFVELHEVDYQSIGLGELGRPEDYVERQVRNWGKQYLKAATEEVPEIEKVMKWLDENQPKEYGFSLIHNDYKYDNVIFEDDTWNSVRAVLDWEMCTLGDPLMDLGTSISYWTMATDNPLIVHGWPSPTSIEGNPSRMEVVEMYAKKSGRPINHLVFYYAYGLFKIAVIVQQIYFRYHKGLTTDKRFANLNEATKMFIGLAWQAIQNKRIENFS